MNPPPSGPSYLRESPEGVELTLMVVPRSSVNALAGVHGEALKLKVTAPPVDSAANAEVVRFLAEILDVPRAPCDSSEGPPVDTSRCGSWGFQDPGSSSG